MNKEGSDVSEADYRSGKIIALDHFAMAVHTKSSEEHACNNNSISNSNIIKDASIESTKNVINYTADEIDMSRDNHNNNFNESSGKPGDNSKTNSTVLPGSPGSQVVATSDSQNEETPRCASRCAESCGDKSFEDSGVLHSPASTVDDEMSMQARIGRERQRYSSTGAILIAGCIPVRVLGQSLGSSGST